MKPAETHLIDLRFSKTLLTQVPPLFWFWDTNTITQLQHFAENTGGEKLAYDAIN